MGDEKVGAAVAITMTWGIFLLRREAVMSQRRDCFALCFKRTTQFARMRTCVFVKLVYYALENQCICE